MAKTFANIGALTSLQIKWDRSGSISSRYKYYNQAAWITFSSSSGTNIQSLAETTGATSVEIQFYTTCVYKSYSSTYKEGWIDSFYFMASSAAPTYFPTKAPTPSPTANPSPAPTYSPTQSPTDSPTTSPTNNPTFSPIRAPTKAPTQPPTDSPTFSPTVFPSSSPSLPPTQNPTSAPSAAPTNTPTISTVSPTVAPSLAPIINPTHFPTNAPSVTPSSPPTNAPSFSPTNNPTNAPSVAPTFSPTYINDIEYGKCVGLLNYKNILYDISQSECIDYCKSNDCIMINHYQYFKNEDDRRCYIFNTQCELSHNTLNNPSSTIWVKQMISKNSTNCNNFPVNWVDAVGDSCNVYEQLGWCSNNDIIS
eukprot:516056_1